MVNQAVTCVALSHRTLLASITTFVLVLLVILAVKPCWKSEPKIVIPPVISFPKVDVGLMLEIPCESVGVVVLVGLGEPRMENMLA
jgi:hypothetical protein